MKKLVFLFSVCATFSAYSQDFNTVYYNANWEVTSMKFGKYYRNSGFNRVTLKFDSIVVDHYMDGSIEMTGRYSNGLKEGEFIYYYPDHSVRLITNYDKNNRTGLWTSFFENGQINEVVEYKDNKERLIKYYNNQGKSIIKNLTGRYSAVFYYNFGFNSFSKSINNDQTEKYALKGKIKNGYKDGQWIIWRYRKVINRTGENNWITNEIPEVMLKIKFDDGNFTDGQNYSHNGEKHTLLSDTLTYFILEPEKISVTEGLLSEPGQLIKHNYVIKAVLDKENKNKKNIVLDNESDIEDFFNSNFSVYAKNCADTLRMTINLKFDDEGKVQVNSVNPKISSSFEKEVYRVINKISKIKMHTGNDYSLIYRIQCLNELDYKK